MGVLYYLQKEDGPELFALNKVYSYAPGLIRVYEEWRDPPTLAELREACDDRVAKREWPDRIHARIEEWASGSRIRCTSEHYWDVYDDEIPGEITGSAYDSDYEDDGVTYKPGSAW